MVKRIRKLNDKQDEHLNEHPSRNKISNRTLHKWLKNFIRAKEIQRSYDLCAGLNKYTYASTASVGFFTRRVQPNNSQISSKYQTFLDSYDMTRDEFRRSVVAIFPDNADQIVIPLGPVPINPNESDDENDNEAVNFVNNDSGPKM